MSGFVLIPCECGMKVEVEMAQAGSDVACQCGEIVNVPSLGELRILSGTGEYVSGIMSEIMHMIETGKLPAGDTCAVSQMPTEDILELYVQCEKSRMIAEKQSGGFISLFFLVLNPLLFFFHAFDQTEGHRYSKPIGHDRGISIPLKVRVEYHAELKRTRNQKKLKKLLISVPEYKKLLQEYPLAKVVVSQ